MTICLKQGFLKWRIKFPKRQEGGYIMNKIELPHQHGEHGNHVEGGLQGGGGVEVTFDSSFHRRR